MFKNTNDHPVDLDNGRTVAAGEVVSLTKVSERERGLLTEVKNKKQATPKSKDQTSEEGS